MTDSRVRHQKTPSWLAPLIKCYSAMDRAVSLALRRRLAAQGVSLACGSDCPQCCRQPIPASIPEMAGAVWRLRTACDRAVQKTVLAALLEPSLSQCPFLVGSRCSIYPLRFLACRGYGIFSSPCRPGEDPWTTRREDLLEADPESKLLAFALLAKLLGHDLALDPEALRKLIMRASPPVQLWNGSHPDLFLQLMEKGPPLPEPRLP